MSEIAKRRVPSVGSVLMLGSHRIDGAPAGEAIASGDACYVDAAGRVRRSLGAAGGEAADVRGFDVTMRYGEDLPLDASLYLSGTVQGGLADAPTPGGARQVAHVVDAAHIHLLQSYDEPATDPVVGRKGPV